MNSSGSVVCDSSVATGEAISDVFTSSETVSYTGFIGQFYDLASGFGVTARPPSIDEGNERQLLPFHFLDDGTGLGFDPSQVTWSVTSGPLTGIDTNGVATADLVYEDTTSVLQATYLSLSKGFSLTVLDAIEDNFGSYANDGLSDDWQNDFFGLDNPVAGPSQDPDGDGQNNQFEELAKVDPTDPDSTFECFLRSEPGQPDVQEIVFSPVFPDRIYRVQTSLDLSAGGWTDLSGLAIEVGDQRTVTDTAAGARRFYQVKINE